MNARQLGELDAREFLGEETWKRWKLHYDECMGYRKSLRGKPTDEQMLQILLNACDIEFYDGVLFHSARLASHGKCACGNCMRKQQGLEPSATKKLMEFLAK